MTINNTIRRTVEGLTRTRIFRLACLPRGADFRHDVAVYLPGHDFTVVFDVGANIGQSAAKYLIWFPTAKVFSFEPAAATFIKLRETFKESKRVHCFQLAFSSAEGEGLFVAEAISETSHLLPAAKPVPDSSPNEYEKVCVRRIDCFCRENGISRISLLKVDTEGGDLEVLKGAADMLAQQRVDLVDVEAGMNCHNAKHVSLECLKAYLESKKYYLFGIYEQVGEWIVRSPHLRRANLVFASQRVLDEHKG